MAVSSFFDTNLEIIRGGVSVATNVRGTIDTIFSSRIARAAVARFSSVTHVVYVGASVDLRDNDVVKKPDGTQFNVLQVFDVAVGRLADHKQAVVGKV